MALREFRDEAGEDWTVYEVKPSASPHGAGFMPGYAKGWLCFQTRHVKRRLLDFPDAWDQLEDQALAGLLEQATPPTASRA